MKLSFAAATAIIWLLLGLAAVHASKPDFRKMDDNYWRGVKLPSPPGPAPDCDDGHICYWNVVVARDKSTRLELCSLLRRVTYDKCWDGISVRRIKPIERHRAMTDKCINAVLKKWRDCSDEAVKNKDSGWAFDFDLDQALRDYKNPRKTVRPRRPRH
ncbi:hypothetical protein HDU96_000517 [Phlyctochytrium bullatum]|nr:hypothetical protein HDU96_000517 [Phlyctochytrium bullatum]